MEDLNTIVYNWSFALLDLASESNKMEKITNEVVIIEKNLKQNREYLKYLNSYSISLDEKYQKIDKAFATFHQYIVNFIKLAIKANVAKYLLIIFKKYIELANAKMNVKYGIIYSTEKLSKEEITKFEKKLSKKLSTEVLLVNKIDKSLLAGIKIKVGDYIIENSIEGFLNTFKKYSIKG